jgi:hypothetical protein
VQPQLYVVQSRLVPGKAGKVFSGIPGHIFLHLIFRNSKQPEIARTQVRRISRVIKAHYVIVPHFVDDSLFIAAGRVTRVHVQLGRLLSHAQNLCTLPEIGQYKVNTVILSEYFIRVKPIDGYRPSPPKRP